jgi:hypothetical protein
VRAFQEQLAVVMGREHQMANTEQLYESQSSLADEIISKIHEMFENPPDFNNCECTVDCYRSLSEKRPQMISTVNEATSTDEWIAALSQGQVSPIGPRLAQLEAPVAEWSRAVDEWCSALDHVIARLRDGELSRSETRVVEVGK